MSALLNAVTKLSSLQVLHEKMWQCAQNLEWDALNAHWQEAEPILATLESADFTKLPAKEAAQAALHIGKILELQREISTRSSEWMEDARPLIGIFTRFPLAAKAKV